MPHSWSPAVADGTLRPHYRSVLLPPPPFCPYYLVSPHPDPRLDLHPSSDPTGECISYSFDEAQEIVMNLFINDGVANRVDRNALTNPDFHFVGMAWGPHQVRARARTPVPKT